MAPSCTSTAADTGSGRIRPGRTPGRCYRRGGPLTVTDANLLLGRIQAGHFPRVFGETGDQSLDTEITRSLFASLSREIEQATGDRRGPEQVAAGFLEIAVQNMANAIKKVSVQRGYDITRYVLSTFGGAGGQHACAVADALGMTRVLIHPLAGVLAAYGLGLADIIAMRETAVEAPLSAELLAGLPGMLAPLEAEARAELLAEGVPADRTHAERRAHLRYDGTDTPVPVPIGPLAGMISTFEQAYRRRFSFLMPDKTVVAEAVSVEVIGTPESGGGGDASAHPVRMAEEQTDSRAHPARPGRDRRRQGRARGEPRPDVHRGRMGAGGTVPAGRAAAGAGGRRASDHRGEPGHDHRRAWLAGGRDGAL